MLGATIKNLLTKWKREFCTPGKVIFIMLQTFSTEREENRVKP